MKRVKDIKKISLFILLISFLNADIRTFLNTKAQITELKNPFFDYAVEKKLFLQAILNDRAKIQDNWYSIGEHIEGVSARIIDIKNGIVFLEKDGEILQLKPERKSYKIIIN